MFHPLTSRLILPAVLFAALVLAGCGGGGDSGVENTLRADFEALEGELEDLQDDLKDATDRADAAEQARRVAEERERQARGDAADDIADAQQARDEARRQTQTLNANRRAEGLLATFPDLVDSQGGPESAASQLTARTRDPMVGITVPEIDQLVFAKPTYDVDSLSAPVGLRAAKLTRTRGGGGTDTIVVYTDRELSRPLLEHYAEFKPAANAVHFEIGPTGGHEDIRVATDTNFLDETELDVSYGSFRNAEPKDAELFSGRVHDIPGEFQCGGTNCKLILMPEYDLHRHQQINQRGNDGDSR